MLKIVVEETGVTEKKGVSKRTNQPYSIKEQQAYAYLLDREGKPLKYPVPVVIPVEEGAPPYAPGEYTVAASSFMAGDFGALKVGRLRLEPLATGKAVRAA